MKKYFSIFTLFVTLLFTGCGYVQPEIQKYTISSSDKVGYIIDIKNKVEYLHVGYGNIQKAYDYKWNFSDYVNNYMKKNTKAKLVDLGLLGYSVEGLKDLIVDKDSQWSIAKEDKYSKLKKLGLKAIILISDEATSRSLPPFNFDIKGTGLVSTNTLGLKRFMFASGIKSRIYLLNPLGSILVEDRQMEILYDPLIGSFEEKSGFKIPKDLENITENEFEPVKKVGFESLNYILETTFKHLNK